MCQVLYMKSSPVRSPLCIILAVDLNITLVRLHIIHTNVYKIHVLLASLLGNINGIFTIVNCYYWTCLKCPWQHWTINYQTFKRIWRWIYKYNAFHLYHLIKSTWPLKTWYMTSISKTCVKIRCSLHLIISAILYFFYHHGSITKIII